MLLSEECARLAVELQLRRLLLRVIATKREVEVGLLELMVLLMLLLLLLLSESRSGGSLLVVRSEESVAVRPADAEMRRRRLLHLHLHGRVNGRRTTVLQRGARGMRLLRLLVTAHVRRLMGRRDGQRQRVVVAGHAVQAGGWLRRVSMQRRLRMLLLLLLMLLLLLLR